MRWKNKNNSFKSLNGFHVDELVAKKQLRDEKGFEFLKTSFPFPHPVSEVTRAQKKAHKFLAGRNEFPNNGLRSFFQIIP